MHALRVLGTYLLFMAFTVNIVALVAPAFYRIYDNESPNSPSRAIGFWSTCECQWYSSPNFKITDAKTDKFTKEMWLHWLYIGSVSIMNISLFTWFILSFFEKRVVYVVMTIIGVFMLLAAGLVAATMAMFAVQAHSVLGVTLGSGGKHFKWGMWMAVPSFVLATLTALVFIIQGPSLYRSHNSDDDDK